MRKIWVVVLVGLMLAVSISDTVATSTLPEGIYLAQFGSNRFLDGVGGGNVTVDFVPELSGGKFFSGRPPGETWTVETYDRGTCSRGTRVIATLEPIVIDGQGNYEVIDAVSEPAAGLLVQTAEQNRHLAVRLSSGGYRTCTRFELQEGID